jgi:hypothetical protein
MIVALLIYTYAHFGLVVAPPLAINSLAVVASVKNIEVTYTKYKDTDDE